MTTLRSVGWDGLAPAEGDVVRMPDGQHLVVHAVAEGAGPGQYRLDCTEARVIDWRPASWAGST
jgi:hypothetical protein